MNDVFGDYEPEDGWDPDDPLPNLVRNLAARWIFITIAADIKDGLGQVAVRRRLAGIAEDLAHLRARIETEL